MTYPFLFYKKSNKFVSHGSNGFSYSTYNGGFTQTLNSNVDRKKEVCEEM